MNRCKPHVFWSPRKKMWIVQQWSTEGNCWLWAPAFSPVSAAKRAARNKWYGFDEQEPRKMFGVK